MPAVRAPQQRAPLAALVAWLPRGRTLPEDIWAARHRGIVGLLWLHALGLPVLALALGDLPLHAAAHGVPLAAIAVAAHLLHGRVLRAVAASVGLLTASALLVHVAGGLTEAHFHFFVIISVVTLYEDWRTFLAAFAYVVLHHGGLGTLVPGAVFAHDTAAAAPWVWAGIHGGFVLAAGVANVVAWRANETAHERRTRHERLRADDAVRQLAALVEATDDAVIGTTPGGIVTTWNPGAERLYGWSARRMVGRSILDAVPPQLREQERARMAEVLADGRLDHYETRRVRADGDVVDVSHALSLVRDGAGEVSGLVGVSRDITQGKRLERERQHQADRLRTLALEDHLTGIGNYRRFHDALDRALAGREGAGPVLSVVLFDLDGFKGVNDRHGHAEGDRVLRLVADALRAGARGADVACRLGGDEFALLLPDTARSGALSVAARIRAAVRAARTDVDVSFGVAAWPEDAPGKDELLVRADAALYAVKAQRGGRDRSLSSVPPQPGEEGSPEADVESALRGLLELARSHLGMDVTVLGEFDDGDEVLRGLSGDAAAFGLALGDRVPLDGTYCRRVVDGRLPNVVADAAHDPRVRDLPLTADAGIGAYVGVPLRMPGGDLYGVLCCLGREAHHGLEDRDVRFLEVLAGIAGEQLERRRVERSAQRLGNQRTGVEALLSALEARDDYTGRHSETVVELAERVARRLGLPEPQVTEVGQVARLHDVGKIGVPDDVLRKRGPLDDDEWVVMRRHAEIGGEIVGTVPGLVHLAPAVRAEHERWDGSGYPDGLAGEDIPLASRITFACDAYDAMVSDRPYRRAMPPAAARAELEANAGSQFDPAVVRALLDELGAKAAEAPAERLAA